MNLYRRPGSTKYHYKFEHKGKVIRKSTKTSNKKAATSIAEAEYANYLVRAAGGQTREDDETPAVTLSTLTARYLEWAKSDHPATAEDEDVRVLKRFTEIVGGGDTFVHTITGSTIDWWRVKRGKDQTRRSTLVTPATVNRELNIVRALFRQAVIWEYIDASPCGSGTTAMKDFKVDDHPVRILTADELERAFQLPSPYNLFCEVTYLTLARLGEVTSLRSEHVSVDRMANSNQLIGSLTKRVKGGKWKRVRIPLPLAQRLRANVTSDDQSFVFPNHANADKTSAEFTRLFREAGLRCSHHAFRHTGITRMLEGGVNPRAIQEHAGWSSLKQLQRYGRVLDQEFARAVEVTGDYLVQARADREAEAKSKTNGGAA